MLQEMNENSSPWLALAVFLMAAFSECIPWAAKKISSSTSSPPSSSARLNTELQGLIAEQKSISMMDEFAKHAKLQRRINAILEEKKKTDEVHRENLSKAYRAFLATFYVIFGLVSLLMMWSFAWTPVVRLPPSWTFPLDWLLRFPSGQPGGIGIPIWSFASRTSVKAVASRSL